MDTLDWIVVAAAGVWGVLVAAAYHWTRIGRFFTARMQWLVVVFLSMSNLVFFFLMANGDGQIQVRDVVAVSAVALIGPVGEGVISLYNYFTRWIDAEKDRGTLQEPVGVTGRTRSDE